MDEDMSLLSADH